MKKNSKKVLAVITVIAMVFSCVPLLSDSFSFTASAAETEGYYTYIISEDRATIADCATSISGDITIPSTLGGYPVTGIGYRAFNECADITGIVIPTGVTSIAISAFRKCTNLKYIEIPDSVTSIGDSAFSKCYSLKEIVVDKENEYYSSDEYGVFFNKDKTELITYPASGEAEHYAIPDSVEAIAESAFRYSKNLVGVTIPDGIVTLEKFVFSECTNLKSVTIPDSVTLIGKQAFYKCSALSEVELGSGVERIGESAFGFCPINILIIPDNVKRIDSGAFNDVNEIYIGKGVETYGGIPKKAKVTVDIENPYYSSDEYGAFIDKEKKVFLHFPSSCELDEYDIPYGIERIGTGAFRRSQLKTINIPSSVKTVGDSAFWECSNLTHIIFPEGITEIGSTALYLCYSIEYIHLPESLTKIGHHFLDGCGLFYICTDSDDCYAKTYIDEKYSSWYKPCDGHGLVNDDSTNDDNINDDNINDDNINDDNINDDNINDDNLNDDNLNDDNINDDNNSNNDKSDLSIKIASTNVSALNYGDTLVLRAEANEANDNTQISWLVEGSGFSTTVSEDGKECYVTSIAKGNATITVQLIDSNGEVITDSNGDEISDKINLSSKAGFFQRLLSFFKFIFGIDRLVY